MQRLHMILYIPQMHWQRISPQKNISVSHPTIPCVLKLNVHIGPIDTDAAESILRTSAEAQTKDDKRVEEARKTRPPLERILNLTDMEVHSCAQVLG